jgi:hypothetical protein
MNNTKRVAEATNCANKENNQPLISESSPLNQRDMNHNSMDGKNGIPPIMENIITVVTYRDGCLIEESGSSILWERSFFSMKEMVKYCKFGCEMTHQLKNLCGGISHRDPSINPVQSGWLTRSSSKGCGYSRWYKVLMIYFIFVLLIFNFEFSNIYFYKSRIHFPLGSLKKIHSAVVLVEITAADST